MIYFTSDTHFSHKNIIQYCNRPFNDVYHMNEEIVKRWNSVVNPNDTVYHLGDVIMGLKEESIKWARRLNGRKILIRGNHDEDKKMPLLEEVFEEIKETHLLGDFPVNVILKHIPHELKASFYGINLCGHVHDEWVEKDGWINVGIDVWGRPVTIEEILREKEERQRKLESGLCLW